MTDERKQAGITAEEFIRNKIHEKFYIPAGVVIDGMSAYAIGADTVVMWAHEFAAFRVADLQAELAEATKEMYLNMQYYMEYCQMKGYVTPQEWIEKHKHF